jgi:NAD(P)-dependent dehydrogenase (short-subunit alcohol dehydrogenase family)
LRCSALVNLKTVSVSLSLGIQISLGPVWTPLIVSTFSPDKVATFGAQAAMQRAAQPEEIAPSYVFLASQDSSYMSGQILHPNGGDVVNG